MATATDEIYVNIITNTEKSMQNLASLVTQLAATYLSFQTLKNAVTESFNAFVASEKSLAQMNSAMKITGQFSEEGSKSLEAFTMNMQRLTIFSHEETQAAASLLMQLGDLTEQGVKKALPVLADWATAVGMDMSTATEQFVRMLSGTNDSMGRFHLGIQQGLDPTDRFNAALDAMRSKVGGLAEEMGKTTAGQLEIFAHQVDEVKEALGGLIAKLANPVLAGFIQIGKFNDAMKMDPKTITDIGVLQAAFDELIKSENELKIGGAIKSETYLQAEKHRYDVQARAIWDQIQAITALNKTHQQEADLMDASMRKAQEFQTFWAGYKSPFSYPSFMGDPGGLRVGEGVATPSPFITNPGGGNGQQLLNNNANDKYFSGFLDNVRNLQTGLSQIPSEVQDITKQANELAKQMGSVANFAYSIGHAFAAGDIVAEMESLAKSALDAIVPWATLAAVEAYAKNDPNWVTFAAIAGLAILGEFGLGALAGAPSSSGAGVAGSGSPAARSVVVNVHGSVIAERDLARTVVAAMSNW